MIGRTVSHYKILDRLGGGGMGVVYKAEDTRLGRLVALKFLPLEFTCDPTAKRRFIHEAKAASALQHNNICAIHEIGESEDGRLFICMDYYDGQTLKEKIKDGPLPLSEALDIAIQAAEGLSKAHSADMIHRDVKPANIIVTNDGVVKIVDFGLAKLAGQTKVTQSGATVGTITCWLDKGFASVILVCRSGIQRSGYVYLGEPSPVAAVDRCHVLEPTANDGRVIDRYIHRGGRPRAVSEKIVKHNISRYNIVF
jgi:serine/threonine protein kinase